MRKIVCPVCGKADQVEKVSTLYLAGIGIRAQPRSAPPQNGANDSLPGKPYTANSGRFALSQKLAPPASGNRAPIRPIHPDIIVIAFSAILPIFLLGIFNSQAGMLLPVTGLLAGFYALYFWQRKKLIARFLNDQSVRRSTDERIKRGVDRWMKLYYCARDDGVFEPGSGQLTPVDQMMGTLYRE